MTHLLDAVDREGPYPPPFAASPPPPASVGSPASRVAGGLQDSTEAPLVVHVPASQTIMTCEVTGAPLQFPASSV